MRILFASLIIIIVDQITKLIVKGFSIPFFNINVDGMSYGERIDVFGSFLRITFVENPGIAFGIDVGISSKLFLSLFSVAASIGIIYYLYKVRHESFMTRLSLALILGGAVGNLIDRTFYGLFYDYAPLFYGKVVDFIDIDFFDVSLFGYTYDRWPIFNVADMSVSIGVILLIFFSKTREKAEPSPEIDTAELLAENPEDGRPAANKNILSETDDKSDNGKEIQI